MKLIEYQMDKSRINVRYRKVGYVIAAALQISAYNTRLFGEISWIMWMKDRACMRMTWIQMSAIMYMQEPYFSTNCWIDIYTEDSPGYRVPLFLLKENARIKVSVK